MITYYITSDLERARQDCTERGWIAASLTRYYVAPKEAVDIIVRFSDFNPATWGISGKAKMIRGAGYDGEGLRGDHQERWAKDREDFEGYVAEGLGEWVEL